MLRAAAALAVVTLIVLAACASPRPAADVRTDMPAEFPEHSAEQIGTLLPSPSDTVQSIRLRAGMNIRSPEQNGSFSASLNYRRADSLYMTISPGLGIEAGRVLVTPDSVFIYNRIDRSLAYGSIDDADAVVPIPVDSAAVLPNLLGMLTLDRGKSWNVTADEERYRLDSADGTERYYVDPTLRRVVRYEKRDGNGTLIEDRTFSDFQRMGGVVVPQRILFRRPQERTTATLNLRELEVNATDLSFALRVRDTAQRIPIRHVEPGEFAPPSE